ncbi:hypothetical protein Z517_00868 [Fonsecaea pedrosoi CBS 271.37]|uniref:Unplaced genomic scaffold supercont1.1, whole genome shotgun sequence n=1 Tax=Fonsecaea pedrosoi CBS 271.37 TaxID=1442368 RepID=A0A0D2FFM9_9EURO|nr:uncharacterized protein Z517_00868 [Fonsecaea pedrosoi CBS 271.37]KIW85477.1 hypothetical protein Z517_00868 [Fonsecaea pedrosoi CBS 271.37]
MDWTDEENQEVPPPPPCSPATPKAVDKNPPAQETLDSNHEDDNHDQHKTNTKKQILCRVVLDKRYAVDPFTFPAAEATTVEALLNKAWPVVTTAVSRYRLKLKPFRTMFFNLQESCTEMPYREYLWTTVNTERDPPGQYTEWYVRNVVNGNGDEEKKVMVEIHVLAKGKAGDEDHTIFEGEMREGGKGGEGASSVMTPYIRLRHSV